MNNSQLRWLKIVVIVLVLGGLGLTYWQANRIPTPDTEYNSALSLRVTGKLAKEGRIYSITANERDGEHKYYLFNSTDVRVMNQLESHIGGVVKVFAERLRPNSTELVLLWVNGQTIPRQSLNEDETISAPAPSFTSIYQAMSPDDQQCLTVNLGAEKLDQILADPSGLTSDVTQQIQACLEK